MVLAGLLDIIFVTSGACTDPLALVVDGASRDIIQPDNGASRGGLAAARFSHKSEHLALVYLETDVIHSLHLPGAHFEILTEIFYFQ